MEKKSYDCALCGVPHSSASECIINKRKRFSFVCHLLKTAKISCVILFSISILLGLLMKNGVGVVEGLIPLQNPISKITIGLISGWGFFSILEVLRRKKI